MRLEWIEQKIIKLVRAIRIYIVGTTPIKK